MYPFEIGQKDGDAFNWESGVGTHAAHPLVSPVERREAWGPYAWQRRNKRVYSKRRYLVGMYVMMMRVRENPLLLWEGLE